MLYGFPYLTSLYLEILSSIFRVAIVNCLFRPPFFSHFFFCYQNPERVWLPFEVPMNLVTLAAAAAVQRTAFD